MKMNKLFIICGTILLVLFVVYRSFLNKAEKINGNVSLAYPNPNDLLYFGSNDKIGFSINDNPKQYLHVYSKGTMKIEAIYNINISVERFNELLNNSEWELIDQFMKNDCVTYLWRNKQTGEEKEGLNSYPPSHRIEIEPK